ncbi:FtsW/RodA/SpoVE family cell cycle protein [Tessaracoccus sp. HDW20]|nr:FtsW/RodA/SpoVE family cell cycle protein [Tessaracoccus coleopterorum]
MALLVYGSGNRMDRIAIFLDPQSNTDLSSQPMSALYALASGGWWGLGLGASRQKYGGLKNGAHTDYIFAVIGEELGLFGVLLVIGLFGMLGWAGLAVAMRSDRMFNKVVAAGITGWFLTQAIINIFVVMHLLPVLGVPSRSSPTAAPRCWPRSSRRGYCWPSHATPPLRAPTSRPAGRSRGRG